MTPHPAGEDLTLVALGEEVAAAAHVRACADCHAEVTALRRAASVGRAAAGLRVPPAPATWWPPIAAAAQGDAPPSRDPEPVTAEGAPPTGWARRPARWLALAAALAAVAVLGAQALVVLQAPEVLAEAVLEPVAGAALPDVEPPAAARLVRSDGGLVLELDGGRPPAEGYLELWLLDDAAGAVLSLGPLAEPGPVAVSLPPGLEVGAFPVIDVSHEHFDGDPTHSGTSLVRGRLDVGASGTAASAAG
jgi:hypothetical protein